MPVVKFATQVEKSVLNELRAFSKENDRSISRVVSEALSEYFQRARVKPLFKTSMDEILNENEELLKRLAK